MKNRTIKFVLIFVIVLFSLALQNVYAKEVNIKLKRIAYTQRINITNGKIDDVSSTRSGIQGMVVTKDYVIVAHNQISTNPNELENIPRKIVYAYYKRSELSKGTYLKEKPVTKLITNDPCGHANDLTYNSDKNQVVCANSRAADYIVLKTFDKNGYLTKGTKISLGNYRINNISYDSTNKVYLAGLDTKIISFKINESTKKIYNVTEITGSNLGSFKINYYDKDKKKNINANFLVNQASLYYNGYLYFVNWICPTEGNTKTNIDRYKSSTNYDVKVNDMLIYSYKISKNKATTANILYNRISSSYKDNIIDNEYKTRKREVESMAYDNGNFYFLFQYGGRTEIYVIADKNVSVQALENNNNNELFQKQNMKAKLTNSTSNFSLNKEVDYNTKEKTYKGSVKFTKSGTYKVDVAQNKKTSSGWTFDNSKLTATVKVSHDLQTTKSVLPNSTITWKNSDNKFTNSFKYEKIGVPLSVSIALSTPDQYATFPTTSAILYDSSGTAKQTVKISNKKYDFGNLYFDKPGTYTYTIKQKNSGTSKNGIYSTTIDKSTIKITIKVKDNNGVLKATTSYSKSKFTNRITASYNTVTNDYSISIKTNKNDSKLPTPKTKAVIKRVISKSKTELISNIDSNNNAYNFSVQIKKPGVYTYQISQGTGITGNNNYTYNLDDSTINLVIVATVSNNKLVCKSTLSSKKFTNSVKVDYDEINVPIKVGIETTNEYNLEIPQTTAVIKGNSLNKEMKTILGQYNYTLSFKKPGKYIYKISQLDMNFDDIVYKKDNSVITATVNVFSEEKAGTLGLSYSVSYSKNEFTNIIEKVVLDPALLSINIPINTEKNSESLSIPTTQAMIILNGETIDTVDSDNEKYKFNLSFEEEGEYKYTIKQKTLEVVQSDNYSIALDDDAITLTIEVIKNDNNTLSVKKSYGTKKSFKNSLTKLFESITINPIYNITFNEENISPVIKAKVFDNEGTVIQSVDSNNGTYNFSLDFNSVGDYYYEVKQENLNGSGTVTFEDYSVSLDLDKKEFIVHVEEKDGNLIGTIEYLYNDTTFENNIIHNYNILNVPLEIGINTMLSNNSINISKTQAILEEFSEEETEYFEIETVESNNNKYKFSSLYFSQPGTYMYRVRQLNSGATQEGIYEYEVSDDSKIITIDVIEDSETGKLTYEIDGIDDVFENKVNILYNSRIIELSANIIEDNQSNLVMPEKTIIFSDSSKVIDEITTTGNFAKTTKIKVDKAGTYTYSILQKRPYNYIENGVEYIFDDSIIKATVVVEANEYDELVYTVTYTKGEEEPVFKNYYKPLELSDTKYIDVPIKIEINAYTDTIRGLETRATLYENGIPIETVSNENGEYIFSSLKHLKKGTYKFTVKQMEYDSEYFVIDSSEIQFEVVVYDEGDESSYEIVNEADLDDDVDYSEFIEDENPELGLSYKISFSNEVSAFTNIDEDAVATPDEDEPQIVDVPNTSFDNPIFIALGMIFIFVGIFVIVNKKDELENVL